MVTITSTRRGLTLACLLALAALAGTLVHGATPRFFPDDPLTREPETQDASKVQPRELSLLYEISENLFAKPGDRNPAGRARNVNTIDQVPDSSWFTNRADSLSAADVARGPDVTTGPAGGPWTIISAKANGITPGFTVRDAAGEVWFVKFDPPGYSNLATGAEVTATKLLWALGYHVPENRIARLDPAALIIDPKTSYEPAGFPRRPLKQSDIRAFLRDAHQEKDGTYRVMASRRLPGHPLGGFRFYGTRPDDPNDIVPHEHRRELRAYVVASAWLNHVDAKSINTLDTLVTEGGQSRVQHYLLDFGSTLGSAAVYPRQYFEGYEYIVEPGRIGKRAASLGFAVEPWRRLPFYESSGIGRLPRDPASFVPDDWRPTVPNAAMERAQPDDKFWMARKVMAIGDEQIRAAVAAGQYTDPADAEFLTKTLIARRDAIGRAYLPAVNPIVNPSLDESGQLTFANAATDAGVAPAPASYSARWWQLDNTDESRDREIGTSEGGASLKAPHGLPTTANAYVRVDLAAVGGANAAWTQPVRIVFRRQTSRWQLVGITR